MKVSLISEYAGLELQSPIVAAASPVTGDEAGLMGLEEAGVGAIVLPSLFEEQILHDEMQVHHVHEFGYEATGEASDYLPDLQIYNTGPEGYLRLVERAKRTVSVPVIASLHGASDGGWVHHARLLEQAGADALELNIYFLCMDPQVSSAQVEQQYVDLVESVRSELTIPLTVKVGPSFASFGHLAARLVKVGAQGLVLFNRYLHPTLDLEAMQVKTHLELSQSYESLLALRWIALLRDHLGVSLAANGGIHTTEDVLRLLLVGADVVQLAAALLRGGPGKVVQLHDGLEQWMREHHYASLSQLRGSMSREHCPDPTAFERVNYVKTLVNFSNRL